MLVTDFPNVTRGRYHIIPEEGATEAEKFLEIKGYLKRIAYNHNTSLVLSSKIHGRGWLLLWWPHNEPRLEITDELFYRRTPFFMKEEVEETDAQTE